MYYIKKEQKIQDKTQTIYYQGDMSWTTNFDDKKLFNLKKEATAELYNFGGKVIKNDVYNPDAIDADGDGIVQEGTIFERELNEI